MKIFSAIVIPNEYRDRIDILYECDNRRNIQCKGHKSCGECHYTSKLKYAKDISERKTRIELEEELQKKDREIEEYKNTIRRMINKENIFNFKTMNEIRKIYNLEPIK